MTIQRIRFLFIVAAMSDGLLGALFLYKPLLPFEWFDLTPPDHVAYVQFPAALVLVFAIMFCQVAISPRRFRGLILYGILFKAAYSGVVFWHWFTTGIPNMWKPFAILDVLFGVLFLWAYLSLMLNRGQGKGATSVPEEMPPAGMTDQEVEPVKEEGPETFDRTTG